MPNNWDSMSQPLGQLRMTHFPDNKPFPGRNVWLFAAFPVYLLIVFMCIFSAAIIPLRVFLFRVADILFFCLVVVLYYIYYIIYYLFIQSFIHSFNINFSPVLYNTDCTNTCPFCRRRNTSNCRTPSSVTCFRPRKT
jgi:hypothetical protein